jgi:uncharacterized protein with HEPN domain
MLESDIVRVQHIIDATNEALSFIAGKSRADLFSDRKLALAVIKSIEIAGEAASRVSQDLRVNSPQIPWQDIVAMRNRLIHGYFDINLDIVWKTVTEELPPLISLLEKLLAGKKPA